MLSNVKGPHARPQKYYLFQKYPKKVVWPFLFYICLVFRTGFRKIRERAINEKMRETYFLEFEPEFCMTINKMLVRWRN